MPIRGMKDKRELDRDKVRQLAFIDDLTEVYNRRYLYRYLPVELKDIQKLGRQLCLFMMDVDNFKGINDTYGHLFGDKVLVEIAQILRQSLREGDTVIRYAGDEFIAILPGIEEPTALKIAKRIGEKIDQHLFSKAETRMQVHVTISIGLAFFPDDAQDPEKLIYQADRALYSSKRSGRNSICTTKEIPVHILEEVKLQELFPCPQLIGRQEQLGQLREMLAKTEKGQVQFALVKGERGIGKSRLISEFRQQEQVEHQGIANIGVSCSPELSRQPYRILIMALEKLKPHLAEDFKTTSAAKAVKTSAGQRSQANIETKKESDIFKKIYQGLLDVAKSKRLLLIIDDFHWIDKQSLQLLSYLIKALQRIPLFIVAAYRQEELAKRAEAQFLTGVLEKLQQEAATTELSLAALEKPDISKMISAVFSGIGVDSEFVTIIYDVSSGNPLFAEELLKVLLKRQYILYQDRTWQTKKVTAEALPPFLKEAIQKRIIELDEETRPVVQAAAVVGKVFDFDILCQLLEKDPGYVLEIIDRAIKQHLIVQDNPFQMDKFKFNSEAIWDAVYANIELRQKQNLHRKLALIEEKAYKDNIGTVAGSLGYHFTQAADTKKADFYTKMLLETTGMPADEDIFSFLQEHFLEKAKEEEEEEAVVALSGESKRLAPKMLRNLRLAIQNIRLYPAHSVVRKELTAEAFKYLTDILNREPTIIIAMVESHLLINGEEISSKDARLAGADALLELMDEHRLRSITFKKNVTKDELIFLLEGFSQGFDTLTPLGGLAGMLGKNDVVHIRINKVRYERAVTLKKRKDKFEEAMLIDYLLGKVSNLTQDKAKAAANIFDNPKEFAHTLKKVTAEAVVKKGQDKLEAQAQLVAKGLQRLDSQLLSQSGTSQGQYQKKVAQAMMLLDDRLRFKVIQALDQTELAPFKDIIKDTFREFSDEEILALTEREFLAGAGNLVNLQRVLHRLLLDLDPQRKQGLLPKLEAKLLELGVSEEEVSWVLQQDYWQGLSLKEKVNKLLRMSPQSYIKLGLSKEMDKLVTQLLDSDQYHQAGEIIDKLLKQVEDKSEQVRSITLNDLAKLSETLIFKEKFFLLEQIVNSLLLRLDEEKGPRAYVLITQVLANICVLLIKKENFIQATGILSEFNLRLAENSKLLDIQKEAIRQTKLKTVASTQLIGYLTKQLEVKIERHQDFWRLSKVIREIGAGAISALFALASAEGLYADPFRTYALRWSIAKVLKDIGEQAVVYLKEKLKDKRVQQIKVAMELLGHLQDKTTVKELAALIKHQDLDVRKEAINTLGKSGGPEAVKLLAQGIKDGNMQIRLATIWALANIGTKEVLPLLKPLLKEKEFSAEVKRIIQRIQRKGK